MIFAEDVQNWFADHPCPPDAAPRQQRVRQAAYALAMSIVENTPTSIEQTEAIMHVRKAVAMCQAAIVCNPDDYRSSEAA